VPKPSARRSFGPRNVKSQKNQTQQHSLASKMPCQVKNRKSPNQTPSGCWNLLSYFTTQKITTLLVFWLVLDWELIKKKNFNLKKKLLGPKVDRTLDSRDEAGLAPELSMG